MGGGAWTSVRGRRGAVLAMAAALATLAPSASSPTSARERSDGSAQAGRARLEVEDLTVRQRVGQLFLIAHFAAGDDPLADIRRLVVERGIGGVVLQSGNNVFRNADQRDLPAQIADHVTTLQGFAIEQGGGIPLFVAVDQEGDGAPFTHLRSGFTPLPSAMAIGATWRPEDAEAIGRIVGAELASVGVNMLLGPVLDVLAEPRVDTGGDIGTRAFGGHPYWVAQMGSAYVRGVHLGSDRRVMTVAKHFPGHGGSDRTPDQEVATVVKDLAALSTIELPPFGAVTASSPGDRDFAAVTEGLMTSHIRYAGLQGNIERRTGPISFDREGLAAVMHLEPFEFEAWRAGGGLIVSDSLGVPAVRRWFSPMGEPLPNRRIARDALMAGNDVLTIAQFADVPAWSAQMANVIDTLDYFEREYRENLDFAERVDDAVRRILARKSGLMPDWSTAGPLGAEGSTDIQPGGEVSLAIVEGVVRRAVTAWRLPALPPARGERIVVITPRDPGSVTGGWLACDDEPCGLPPERLTALRRLGPTLVEQILVERYGPRGVGIVDPERVTSLAFCELEGALGPELPAISTATPSSEPEPATEGRSEGAAGDPNPASASGTCVSGRAREAVLSALGTADWIVIAFGALDPDEVRVLRGLFLPHVNRIAIATGAQLAVLSFGPPYLIDATNLSGLDAYVSAYTKIPAAVEAAIEVLFGDLDAAGHSPVTVEEAGYRLSDRLQPAPGARIPMSVETRPPPAGMAGPVVAALAIGPVVDMNGHPVPDRTVVEIEAEPMEALDVEPPVLGHTTGGMVRTELALVRGGDIVIRASIGDGRGADAQARLRLDPVPPTIEPGAAPRAAGAGGAAIADAPAGDPPADGLTTGSGDASGARRRLAPSDLLPTLLAVLVAAIAGAASPISPPNPLARSRTALSAVVAGLGAYVIYAVLLGLGSIGRPSGGAADAVVVGVLGSLVGLGLAAPAVRRDPVTAPSSAPPLPRQGSERAR